MKRGLVVIAILLVVGALAGGWWWARTAPEQAAQFLVDGGLQADKAVQFVAAVGGVDEPEEPERLLASGSIEGEEISIVSEFGGRIISLPAEEGDQVGQGDVLATLDTSMLEAKLAEVDAAVVAAEASLDYVAAGSHPAELLAAEAQLQQAEATLVAAKSALGDAQAILRDPQDIAARIVQAEAAIQLAAGRLEQSGAQIAEAEALRFEYRAQGSMEEKWMYKVYDYQVLAAQAAYEAALSEKQMAERNRSALVSFRNNPLILESQVHAAMGRCRVAEAGLRVAEAKVAEIEAGASPEELAMAEAHVEKAKAGRAVLLVQMEKAKLRSPLAGIVTSQSAHVGEVTSPGETILTIADLDEVTLTIYVPEDELGLVYLGQSVQVTVDSYSDQVFEGTVSHIAQEAEFTPKNVQTEKERVNMVFAVRVRVPNNDHSLKPGMPADALLKVE